MRLECLQLFVPQVLDLPEPITHGSERGRINAEHTHARVLAHTLVDDEARAAQHTQVPAQRGWTHFNHLRKFARALRLAQQGADDGTARGIGKRRERGIELITVARALSGPADYARAA